MTDQPSPPAEVSFEHDVRPLTQSFENSRSPLASDIGHGRNRATG